MIKTIKRALCLSSALLCFAMPAAAGYDMTRTSAGVGTCVPETNPNFNLNMVYCYGTMAGIRNQSADSGRFVYFSTGTTGSLLFTMVVNNVGYSCTAPSSMQSIWDVAISAPNQFFWLAFDKSTGVCKSLSLSGGSHYR